MTPWTYMTYGTYMTYTSPKTHNPGPGTQPGLPQWSAAALVLCASFCSAGGSAGFAEAFGHRQDDRA